MTSEFRKFHRAHPFQFAMWVQLLTVGAVIFVLLGCVTLSVGFHRKIHEGVVFEIMAAWYCFLLAFWMLQKRKTKSEAAQSS